MLSPILALVAAALFAWASVAQQRAASSIPVGEAGGARLIVRLVRRPLWVSGLVADTLGFVAQAAALGVGVLLIVQPLIATTLLFAIAIAAMWSRVGPPRSVWLSAALLTGGLAAFLVVGDPGAGIPDGSLAHWAIAGAIVIPVVAIAVVAGARRRGPVRALGFGIASGVLFGVMSALIKSVVDNFGNGLESALTNWEIYALILTTGLGFILQQAAYQAGALGLSLPAIVVLEPVTAAAIGIWVLDESLRTEGPRSVAIALSVVAMVVGLVAIAKAEAGIELAQGRAAPSAKPMVDSPGPDQEEPRVVG